MYQMGETINIKLLTNKFKLIDNICFNSTFRIWLEKEKVKLRLNFQEIVKNTDFMPNRLDNTSFGQIEV